VGRTPPELRAPAGVAQAPGVCTIAGLSDFFWRLVFEEREKSEEGSDKKHESSVKYVPVHWR